MENNKITFFYIRRVEENSSSKNPYMTAMHRVGCVAVERIGDTPKIRAAISFTHPNDRFDAQYARETAVDRLNNDMRSKVIDLSNTFFSDSMAFTALSKALNIHGLLDEHYPTFSLGLADDTLNKNRRCFVGAMMDLFAPKA